MTVRDDDALLRAHYELEKRLAKRLRDAGREERASLYEEVYDELYRDLRGMGRQHVVEQNPPGQVRLCVDLLRPLVRPGDAFIEFGAGDGALTRAVADQLAPGRSLAVDASSEATAAGACSSKVEVVAPTDVEGLADESIDVAFSCHLIEHLHEEDMIDHLTEVRRLLRTGGSYLMVTPNRLLGPHDVSRDFDEVASGLHLVEYSFTELAEVACREGFACQAMLIDAAGRVQPRSLLALRFVESLFGYLPT